MNIDNNPACSGFLSRLNICFEPFYLVSTEISILLGILVTVQDYEMGIAVIIRIIRSGFCS
ncbi:hypothetical protein D3C75_1258700 [compost metagenome]